MIRRWDDRPNWIRIIDDPVEDFRSLAEFQAEFEAFEYKVTELAVPIDGRSSTRPTSRGASEQVGATGASLPCEANLGQHLVNLVVREHFN